MENGPDTVIGSGGARLSGGQAQRLALARTLAHPRPPLVLARIIDRLTGGLPLSLLAALLYFGSLALEGILSSAQESLLVLFGQKMTHALRREMSQKLTQLPVATLVEQNPGEVAGRFSGDVDAVEALFTSGIISMVADACRILSILGVIAVKNTGLALVLLLVLPLLAVFTRHVQKRMLAAQLDHRHAVATVSGQVSETLHNIRTIHALGLEDYIERRYERRIGDSYAAVERTNFYDAVYSPVVLLLDAVVVGVVMLLSASGNAELLTLFGMSVGTSVAVISYISRIFAPIESLGMEIQTIQSAMAGVRRIDAFLAQPERDIPPEREEARGDVVFSHVTFGYGESHVLTDFSMTVKQGEQVMLVGWTGVGKSTVFKLLLGLYRPEAGTVTIGGVDASAIPDRQRRICIGCVEQHFSRIPGTVLEQITLCDPQRQTPLCCCWMRSPPIWMPRRRPVYGRPCVRPPVDAPSSPFPTASMRALAAGLWRSGPKDSKCRECSPGGHGASGAVKNRGKKRLTVPMGSAMMGCGQKRPISAINGGECSWIAAEVQDEAGYAARRDTGCGHPWTGADHILLCRVLLHRTGDVLLWQLSLRRCIFAPILPKVASKEDKNMMNRMVNKEFAQEIAAVIRTAQNGDRLPELLKHYHQRDVAKAVTLLTDAERERLFRQLDARTLAEIFPYLDDAARFLAELPADLAAAVITDMDTADALDMLRELPAEKKQALAAHLDDDTRKDVRRLLAFHQEEIGSRMSGNFVCIPDTLTVCGAMNELVRQAGEHDNISTLYVVDGSGVFAGAIDLKDLIIARENDPLSGIIRRSYPYVLAHEKVEDCIDRIAEYEEDSLPVLTEDGRIAGILTAQDLVELVDDAMGDDYAKLGGLTSEEDLREPAAVSMKKRLPWLIVLLFLGMGVSSVVGIFESVVAVLPIVICFQSLVLDMAGNVGTQSLAVTIRVLMDENLTLKEELALLGKEMRVGLLNGGCLGLMALAVLGVYIHVCKGYAWGPAFLISGCVGVSLVVAMVISSLVGTMVPMLFHKIHIDPAVASGPLITTVNDLVAVVTYYGLALLFLVNVFHL